MRFAAPARAINARAAPSLVCCAAALARGCSGAAALSGGISTPTGLVHAARSAAHASAAAERAAHARTRPRPRAHAFCRLMVDRHTFLDAQPWLRPCAADALSPPVFEGLASLSLSLREQYAPDAPQGSPLGAAAPDSQFLFFAVSAALPDATQLRASMHAGAAGDVTLLLDGRAYAVDGGAIGAITARAPESGAAYPPFVSFLFPRVTLTLMPAPGRAWAVEAPLLLAAANCMARARLVRARAASVC